MISKGFYFSSKIEKNKGDRDFKGMGMQYPNVSFDHKVASDSIQRQKQTCFIQQEAGRPVISAIDHIFDGFTGVINPHWMLGKHLKTYESLASGL